MNITLRQLGYFKALAEQRHFGRAAEIAHVSQPALSVQIQELEKALNGKLVERRARDVVLTVFGREILQHANRVLVAAEELEQAGQRDTELSGQLRLGVIPTVAPYILPETLAALRSGDISLDVQILEAKTERLLADLRSGTLDAAVMALPSGGRGVVDIPLFEDRFLLAGSAARLAQMNAVPLEPDAIGTGPLLLLEEGHCLSDQALEVCGRNRTHAQIDMGASSLATLTRLVAAGFGLTMMPELAARAEQRAAPAMMLKRFDGVEPARQIGLVRRSSSGESEWFTALARVLREVGEALVQETRNKPLDLKPS